MTNFESNVDDFHKESAAAKRLAESQTNHEQAYTRVKEVVELWWNSNITRLELIAQIATILVSHEALEGGN